MRKEATVGERSHQRARWVARLAWAVFAAAVVALVAGFVREAGAWAIVKAPNYDRPVLEMTPTPASVSRVIRAEVGPPVALLEAWVLDPVGPPRGTTLVLHGIRGDKRALVGIGERLRDRGMRAVLVDLRGHGGSSGRWLTYGVVESRDLAQLLDQLEALDILEGPVSVYGASYGGAVGLQLAAIDPRVSAVASLSTFSSLRAVVPPYAERQLPTVGAWIPSFFLDSIVRDAGLLGGFSPDEADTAGAIGRTRARVLLLHGDADRNVPFLHAQALLRACRPGRCELVRIPGADHGGALGSETANARALDFLERWGTELPTAGGAADPPPLFVP